MIPWLIHTLGPNMSRRPQNFEKFLTPVQTQCDSQNVSKKEETSFVPKENIQDKNETFQRQYRALLLDVSQMDSVLNNYMQ